MSRHALLLALSAALMPGLVSAEDTTVYKSKGASGETVYSQIETEDAEAHRVGTSEPDAPPAAAAQAPAKSPAEQACDRAKANYELLASDKRVQFDRDGDGTPDEMNAEERASNTDMAKRQVDAYCTPAAEGQ